MLLTAAGIGVVCGPVTIGALGALPTPSQAKDDIVSASGNDFELASIKARKGSDKGFHITGDRGLWQAINVAPKFLIETAYDLRPGQLIGAPNWAETERYDIEGKFDGRRGLLPRVDRVGPFIQSVLAGRFQLKFHDETKEMPVYLLSVSKSGPKLKESDRAAVGPRVRMSIGQWNFVKVRMEGLARELSRQLGRPVLDQTGLTGSYDFEVSFSAELPPGAGTAAYDGPPLPVNDPAAVVTAVQEQLGLKLDSKTAPIRLLVIDRIEKPAEN
jgi:uncharacterized protein (TIGR03435 family)